MRLWLCTKSFGDFEKGRLYQTHVGFLKRQSELFGVSYQDHFLEIRPAKKGLDDGIRLKVVKKKEKDGGEV
ncbi:MAG: hypothetical protein D6816_02870 [Bacteroidetes bacterium]|nr:MAG: hypothetical protein D6816_02870 [Bacteroidota bacterium]